jgi:hypothetical protein
MLLSTLSARNLMAVYYAVGDALVTHDELSAKAGEMSDFAVSMDQGGGAAVTATVDFSNGSLSAENVVTVFTDDAGEPTPFTPVEMGKPLAVELRHVYTGRYPRKTLFDSTRDLLVTSAMKGIAVYNAAPRAVNVMRREIGKHAYVQPRAVDNGTSLMFYTPALTATSSLLTVEMVFDEFPQAAVDALGGAISSSASIPVFAPAAAYLLAAGSLVKLAGKAAESVFDGTPVFSATDELAFKRPGVAAPIADFRVLTDEKLDPQVLKDYKVGAGGRLVHVETGAEYAGDEPYVVISLDGAEVKEYESFTPTAASAALLDRFFGIREGKEQPVDMLVDALKLYNDYQFRGKADALKKRLDGLKEGTEEHKTAKDEYDALVKNILSDVLKPK